MLSAARSGKKIRRTHINGMQTVPFALRLPFVRLDSCSGRGYVVLYVTCSLLADELFVYDDSVI